MNKILRKVRKIFYRYQIRPDPRFGRLHKLKDALCNNQLYYAKIQHSYETSVKFPDYLCFFCENYALVK